MKKLLSILLTLTLLVSFSQRRPGLGAPMGARRGPVGL